MGPGLSTGGFNPFAALTGGGAPAPMPPTGPAPVTSNLLSTLFPQGQGAAPAPEAPTARPQLTFNNPGQEAIGPELQSALRGEPLTITSGYRSPEHPVEKAKAEPGTHAHRIAADIDLTGKSPEERAALVKRLQAQGIRRFGTYTNMPDILHVDLKDQTGDGKTTWFMHDKSNKNLGKAPDWFRGVASGSSGASPRPSLPIPGAGAGRSGLEAERRAIRSIESGTPEGRYDLLGPVTKTGDRAYGAYQVMGANIGPWTQEVLGHRLSPREFLADRAAQDRVFDAKFGGNKAKYGNSADAASIWFTGRPQGGSASGSRDSLGTSGADYVAKFNKAMAEQGIGATTASDFTLPTLERRQSDPTMRPRNDPPGTTDVMAGGEGEGEAQAQVVRGKMAGVLGQPLAPPAPLASTRRLRSLSPAATIAAIRELGRQGGPTV